MEIRILRLFHWNYEGFLWTDLVSLKRENGERESNSGRMKESCDNNHDRWARVPLFPLAAAEWRVCTLTDAHSSAQSKMNVIAQYSETLPKTQHALHSHTRPLFFSFFFFRPLTQGHFIQWDDSEMLSLAVFLLAVKWGLCFLPRVICSSGVTC